MRRPLERRSPGEFPGGKLCIPQAPSGKDQPLSPRVCKLPSPQVLGSWLMGTVRDSRVKATIRVLGQSVVQGRASCGF